MHIALFPFSTFLRTGTMSVIPAVPFFTFIIFITGMPLQSSAASFPAKRAFAAGASALLKLRTFFRNLYRRHIRLFCEQFNCRRN